ncbi:hypothetical protein BCR33DRAFT_267953 [Rhizoclosmatium globosum]|uniref:Homeobox domain-containing protein n=1 Tax=Rhizoclosmatium globosum TaxID=329046 RepID=A0A1Y2C7I3_9FUNG|nr:hypothetical protein BCR33DRAFT_267953 [Rhizoclosmatium globosum]|eukprot:ORY42991.1 hypothetical protein BCR33DRAFT_267953 [Rhizoclosmatium globosum]
MDVDMDVSVSTTDKDSRISAETIDTFIKNQKLSQVEKMDHLKYVPPKTKTSVKKATSKTVSVEAGRMFDCEIEIAGVLDNVERRLRSDEVLATILNTMAAECIAYQYGRKLATPLVYFIEFGNLVATYLKYHPDAKYIAIDFEDGIPRISSTTVAASNSTVALNKFAEAATRIYRHKLFPVEMGNLDVVLSASELPLSAWNQLRAGAVEQAKLNPQDSFVLVLDTLVKFFASPIKDATHCEMGTLVFLACLNQDADLAKVSGLVFSKPTKNLVTVERAKLLEKIVLKGRPYLVLLDEEGEGQFVICLNNNWSAAKKESVVSGLVHDWMAVLFDSNSDVGKGVRKLMKTQDKWNTKKFVFETFVESVKELFKQEPEDLIGAGKEDARDEEAGADLGVVADDESDDEEEAELVDEEKKDVVENNNSTKKLSVNDLRFATHLDFMFTLFKWNTSPTSGVKAAISRHCNVEANAVTAWFQSKKLQRTPFPPFTESPAALELINEFSRMNSDFEIHGHSQSTAVLTAKEWGDSLNVRNTSKYAKIPAKDTVFVFEVRSKLAQSIRVNVKVTASEELVAGLNFVASRETSNSGPLMKGRIRKDNIETAFSFQVAVISSMLNNSPPTTCEPFDPAPVILSNKQHVLSLLSANSSRIVDFEFNFKKAEREKGEEGQANTQSKVEADAADNQLWEGSVTASSVLLSNIVGVAEVVQLLMKKGHGFTQLLPVIESTCPSLHWIQAANEVKTHIKAWADKLSSKDILVQFLGFNRAYTGQFGQDMCQISAKDKYRPLTMTNLINTGGSSSDKPNMRLGLRAPDPLAPSNPSFVKEVNAYNLALRQYAVGGNKEAPQVEFVYARIGNILPNIGSTVAEKEAANLVKTLEQDQIKEELKGMSKDDKKLQKEAVITQKKEMKEKKEAEKNLKKLAKETAKLQKQLDKEAGIKVAGRKSAANKLEKVSALSDDTQDLNMIKLNFLRPVPLIMPRSDRSYQEIADSTAHLDHVEFLVAESELIYKDGRLQLHIPLRRDAKPKEESFPRHVPKLPPPPRNLPNEPSKKPNNPDEFIGSAGASHKQKRKLFQEKASEDMCTDADVLKSFEYVEGAMPACLKGLTPSAYMKTCDAWLWQLEDNLGKDWAPQANGLKSEATLDPGLSLFQVIYCGGGLVILIGGNLAHEVREHLKENVRLHVMFLRKVNNDLLYKSAQDAYEKANTKFINDVAKKSSERGAVLGKLEEARNKDYEAARRKVCAATIAKKQEQWDKQDAMFLRRTPEEIAANPFPARIRVLSELQEMARNESEIRRKVDLVHALTRSILIRFNIVNSPDFNAGDLIGKNGSSELSGHPHTLTSHRVSEQPQEGIYNTQKDPHCHWRAVHIQTLP